jgi:hypothetical protein
MWVLWNKSTYVSVPRWRVVKNLYLSIAKFARCLLHENWSLWLYMYVICYFGEHMSCGSINIYCAMWIEQTTNKSCQNFPFFVKNSKNRFISRLPGSLERFFTGKSSWIQIDLNWSNWSAFTGFYRFTVGKPLSVDSGFRIGNGFVNRASNRCGKGQGKESEEPSTSGWFQNLSHDILSK